MRRGLCVGVCASALVSSGVGADVLSPGSQSVLDLLVDYGDGEEEEYRFDSNGSPITVGRVPRNGLMVERNEGSQAEFVSQQFPELPAFPFGGIASSFEPGLSGEFGTIPAAGESALTGGHQVDVDQDDMEEDDGAVIDWTAIDTLDLTKSLGGGIRYEGPDLTGGDVMQMDDFANPDSFFAIVGGVANTDGFVTGSQGTMGQHPTPVRDYAHEYSTTQGQYSTAHGQYSTAHGQYSATHGSPVGGSAERPQIWGASFSLITPDERIPGAELGSYFSDLDVEDDLGFEEEGLGSSEDDFFGNGEESSEDGDNVSSEDGDNEDDDATFAQRDNSSNAHLPTNQGLSLPRRFVDVSDRTSEDADDERTMALEGSGSSVSSGERTVFYRPEGHENKMSVEEEGSSPPSDRSATETSLTESPASITASPDSLIDSPDSLIGSPVSVIPGYVTITPARSPKGKSAEVFKALTSRRPTKHKVSKKSRKVVVKATDENSLSETPKPKVKKVYKNEIGRNELKNLIDGLSSPADVARLRKSVGGSQSADPVRVDTLGWDSLEGKEEDLPASVPMSRSLRGSTEKQRATVRPRSERGSSSNSNGRVRTQPSDKTKSDPRPSDGTVSPPMGARQRDSNGRYLPN